MVSLRFGSATQGPNEWSTHANVQLENQPIVVATELLEVGGRMIIQGLTGFTTDVHAFVSFLEAIAEDTTVTFVFADDTAVVFKADELIAAGRRLLTRHANVFARVGRGTSGEEALALLEALACFHRDLGLESHAANTADDIVTRLLIEDVGRRLRGLVQEVAFVIADEGDRISDSLRWSKSRPKIVDLIREADEAAKISPPKVPPQMSMSTANMLRNALPTTDSLFPTTNRKAFSCSFVLEDGSTCQYSVGRRDYLDTHQAKVHGKDGEDWVCSRCNYKGVGRKAQSKHKREGPCAKEANLEALAVAAGAAGTTDGSVKSSPANDAAIAKGPNLVSAATPTPAPAPDPTTSSTTPAASATCANHTSSISCARKAATSATAPTTTSSGATRTGSSSAAPTTPADAPSVAPTVSKADTSKTSKTSKSSKSHSNTSNLSKTSNSSNSSSASAKSAKLSSATSAVSATSKKSLPTAALGGTRPRVQVPAPNENLDFYCSNCEKTMPSAAMYKIHAPCFAPDACADCGFVAGGEAQLRAHRLAKHPRNDKDGQQAAKQAAATKKRLDEMTAAKRKAEDDAADKAGKRRKWTRGQGKDPCSNPQCTSSSKFGNFFTSEGWPLCNPCGEFPFLFHMLLRFRLTNSGSFGAQGRDGGSTEEASPTRRTMGTT